MPPRAVPLALILFAVSASAARSQPGPQVQDGKFVLKMTVTPAAPPVPALRYTLLPTVVDGRPGNQVPAFYKCFMEQNNLFFNKEVEDAREAWLAAPLDELKDVRELVDYGGTAVKQARRAARMEYVDWQILQEMKDDGINTLLPDVQQMRRIAQVLRVRARGEIARGDFPAAADTIQIQLALARTFNDHPTLIGSLVGIAVASQALASVEEFVSRPGAPNLYWALTDLPAPFFDLRKGAHGERKFITDELARLIDHKTPMTDEQLDTAVVKLNDLLGSMTLQTAVAPKDGPVARGKRRPATKTLDLYLEERAQDPKQVAAARKSLVADRRLPAEKFPAMQVILLDETTRFEAAQDDLVKWYALPYWQIPADVGKNQPPGPLGQVLPTTLKVPAARARLQQQIGMLQAVEGLRLYAADNGGRLPATLADLRLPLPPDPFTGQPFRYELADGVGVLRGTPPADRAGEPTYNRVYEVRVAR